MRTDTDATVVQPSPAERVVAWVALPLLGAGAGWLLNAAAGPIAGLPWAPIQGPFELVASLPEPHATIGGLALGAVVGLVLAILAHGDYVTATIGPTEATVAHGESTHTVRRAELGAVFVDGKQLVLLDTDRAELARVGGDLSASRLGAAFREHGYPWHDGGDPHRDEYHRWASGVPGLPDGADALLSARRRALRGKESDDATQLRAELAALGVVVRDEDKQQYWRLARPRSVDSDRRS